MGCAAGLREGVRALDEVLAGGPQQSHVALHPGCDCEGRIDADGPGARQCEAVTEAHPDLEVRAGLQQPVQVLRQFVPGQPRRGWATQGSSVAQTRSS